MEQSNLKQYLEDQLNADSIDTQAQATVWNRVNKEIKNQNWKVSVAIAFFSLTAVMVLVVGIGAGVLLNSTRETEQTIAEDNQEIVEYIQEDQKESENPIPNESSNFDSNQVIAEEIDLLLASIIQDTGRLQPEKDFEDIGL